ncbi:GAF domain-containing protein [Persicobacter diffluens]|uniref:HAMP domain-containing protein n=1 Tax=Persicobacter diffluens TaxID=981 RepID=A0AAN4W1W1_9BACT|nr:hypothetical protein PEDI_37480 [Persicobacter diffluens]
MKEKKTMGIGAQIRTSYIIIMLMVFGAGGLAIFLIHKNNKLDRQIVEINFPLQERLIRYQQLINNSYDLTYNWVFNPNVDAQNRLKIILNEEMPALALEIQQISQPLPSLREAVGQTIPSIDSLVLLEKKITQLLASDEQYMDDEIVEKAILLIEGDILTKRNEINTMLRQFIEARKKELLEGQEAKATANNFILILMIITFVLTAAVSIIASLYIRKQVIQPILDLKDGLIALGQGEIIDIPERRTKDEIHEMIIAMKSLTEGLESKIKFSYEIGKGNYDQDFEQVSEKDSMGIALIKMRDSLKTNDEENKRRNWASNGLAQIAEVLRNYERSAEDLYDQVIRFICKYTNSNQGAIFLLEEETEKEPFLEMVACYAYERKKFEEKKVEIGDGLVGQCYLEKASIFLTEIPQNYVKITSGLGESTPTCILITPLIVNEQIFGVLELASFNKFQEHEIAFIEKVSETLASSIFNIKGSIRTQNLLNDSQIQAQQLKEKEEELQQNLEELRATQEQLEREKLELLRQQEADNSTG